MNSKKKYSFIEIKDNDGESFKPSICNCEHCVYTHLSQSEWKTFKPETNLQKRMKTIIKDIEEKYCNVKQ